MKDALQPGGPRRVGRYRLLKQLGTGGMGRVYLGQSPSGRLVAVKVIRPELADDPDFRRRFAQEVTAARRVSGIFTAPVVDADPDGPRPWMVTAFVEGPSLADAVASQGPLPVASVLTLAAGLAEGLGAVHAAGVVHRDLKPSNVLLASDGPRIIDFGISRAADMTGLTRGGDVVGSPGFMSPEQAEGRPVGRATDIFSLGGVLVYAATGEPPFGAGSPSALLYRVVYGAAATGNVPAELRPLIERCLAKDPDARPTTDQLLAELGSPEPGEDWLTWERPAVWQPASLHQTELDERIAELADPRQAADASRARNGYPGQDQDTFPAGPTAVNRTVPVDAPEKRPRRNLLIGLAAAAVVAVAAGTAVGAEVLSEHHGGQPGAQSSISSHTSLAGGVSHKSGGQAEHPGGGSGQPGGQAQTQPAKPRTVVVTYYAAINRRDWLAVWRLGGRNLSSSYQAMVAGYAETARDVLRYIRVRGDRVNVRLWAYESTGAMQTYDVELVVQDGVIVSASQQLVPA